MAFKLWYLNSPWKVDTENLSRNWISTLASLFEESFLESFLTRKPARWWVFRTEKLARVQVKTQKLMRVSWQVQVAHKPVLVATVDTVKALKCWFDIVYIYIYTCIPKETCWMAFKLWTLNSCWKVDTEKLSHNQI